MKMREMWMRGFGKDPLTEDLIFEYRGERKWLSGRFKTLRI